jgi:hypothetical protein
MLEFKTRLVAPALLLLAGVALSGCEASKDGPEFPPPAPTTFNALFNPTASVLPWPIDLLFKDTTDGTLNIPSAAAAFVPATPLLNALDGFSTTAPIGTSFNQAIDGASLGPQGVVVIELRMAKPSVPASVVRPLQYGVDYQAGVSPSYDSAGKILEITPLKPLNASSGPVVAPIKNVGYLVLLTDKLRDINGRSAEPDQTYAAFKDAPADCSSFTGSSRDLCLLTKVHLGIAQAVGVSPESVVLSWTFTTQSVDDVFAVVAQLAQPQPIVVVPTGKTTADLDPRFPGKASIYAGITVLPYYLTEAASPSDKAFLSVPWIAAGPSPVPGFDPDSRNLTRYNPVPLKTSDVTVPVLVTVPNATANNGAGCPRPEAGWPVAIFQHGYPRDRTDALLIADALAEGCFIMAAIDLPLHGITNPANPLYDAAHERTFNVDLIDNATGKAGADGKIDPTGSNYVNGNFLVTRDNLRQSSADVMTFVKTVTNLDVTGDGQPDVDPARVHLVSLSIGGMVSIPAIKFSPTIRTATIADAGGVVTRLLLDSPQQSPAIRARLIALGLVENSTIYNNLWLRDVQTIIDAGDPINHILGAQQTHPMHMSKIIGDTNVPNSAFDRLALAGEFTQLSTPGATSIVAGSGRFVAVTEGGHGSLIYPIYSLPATLELQSQTVKFAVSSAIVIENTSIIQPAP